MASCVPCKARQGPFSPKKAVEHADSNQEASRKRPLPEGPAVESSASLERAPMPAASTSSPPPAWGLSSRKCLALSARTFSKGPLPPVSSARTLFGDSDDPAASLNLKSVSSLEGATKVNGFDAVPDWEALVVQASNVAPFSLPQEVLTYAPCREAVIAQFKNGESERKVHCNIELTQEEQQKLAIMRELAQAQGKAFTPALATAATRYLARAKGDPKRAVKDMAATQEWRKEFFQAGPIIDKSVEEYLSHGIVYFTGRDVLLRPTLVVRPARIPAAWFNDKKTSTDRVVRVLVFCIEYMVRYMVLPGHVEGGVVLMDMGGLSLSQVPFSPMKSIMSVLANHYVNRIFKFYVFNLPSALSSALSFGLRMLTERQRQKVQVVRGVEELRQQFALHQLETDLGGSRPAIDKFYPFPLQPGPFEAGSTSGPNSGAVPDVHLALDFSSILGRVWDPAATPEVNTRMRYTEAAADVLARCGLRCPAPGAPPRACLLPTAEALEAGAGSPAVAPSGAPERLPEGAGAPGVTASSPAAAVAEEEEEAARRSTDDAQPSQKPAETPTPLLAGEGKGDNASTSAGSSVEQEFTAREAMAEEGNEVLLKDESSFVSPAKSYFSWLPACGVTMRCK